MPFGFFKFKELINNQLLERNNQNIFEIEDLKLNGKCKLCLKVHASILSISLRGYMQKRHISTKSSPIKRIV